MKRLILALCLCALAAAPIRADEIGTPWSIWLYDPGCPAPKIVRVGLDGSAEIRPFGCPDSGAFPSPVAFSADMTRMAYCKYGSLRVVDFEADFDFRIEINDDGDCSVTSEAFDRADKRWLAVGTTHYLGATPTERARAFGELLVLDIDRVSITARMTTDSGALAPYYRQTYPNTAEMPYVRRFEDGQIIFAPILWSSELPSRFRAVFEWPVGSAFVTPTSTDGQWGQDQLDGSGETVWYDSNADLPQASAMGSASVYNVVMWSSPGLAPRRIYTAPLVISNTTFIDGGARIAFRVSAFDRPDRWLALDRRAVIAELPVSAGALALVGTPDGYVFLDRLDNPAQTRLYHAGPDGTPMLLWQDADPDWQLARSTPLPMPASPQRAFPTFRPAG